MFFKCDTQWFHFTCVGLSSAPKGKWFCPTCVNLKKKRKEKQQLNVQSLTNSQTNIIVNSNNESKIAASSANDIYNDEFDFKFQMPKIFNKQKQQEQQQSIQKNNME
jgi:hypothetical protein